MKNSFERIKIILQKDSVLLFLLVLLTVIISTKDISRGEFREADAFAHAMNGVFIHDFIKDMPFQSPYGYALNYYAKYPAITIPYHPPFFPAIEALFFFVFGISAVTARLTVVFFAVVAVVSWYYLIRSMFSNAIAFISGVLFITAPTALFFTKEVMLEMPSLAMVILSIYFFHGAIDHEKKRHLIYCAISTGLAMWTKQTTVFLIPLLLSYLVIRKKYHLILSREGVVSIFIFLCLSVPLVIITHKFASFAIDQAVSETTKLGYEKASSKNVLLYIEKLPDIIPIPVIAMSLVASMLALFQKNKARVLFFILWIIWVYILVSYLAVKEARYAYYWIPPFCLLAALLYEQVKFRIKNIRIAPLVLIVICLFQIRNAYGMQTQYIAGYEKAAKYVLDNFKGDTLLVSAYFHGNITFFIRKHDTTGKVVVLRDNKILRDQRAPTYNPDDIYNVLEKFGIKYIVVESTDRKEDRRRIYKLREILNNGEFKLVKKFDLDTSMDLYRGHSILIYEFARDVKLQEDSLQLYFRRMGKHIELPFKRKF